MLKEDGNKRGRVIFLSVISKGVCLLQLVSKANLEMTIKYLKIFCVVVSSWLFIAASTVDASELKSNPPIRIAVADYYDTALTNEFLKKTIESLRSQFATQKVEVFNLPGAQMLSQKIVDTFDFVIVSPLLLQELPHEKNRIIATRSLAASDGQSSAGTALVLKNREDLSDWNSLKGKTALTTLPTDLAAWLSIVKELHKHGYDAEKHFSSLNYVQYEFPEIFTALITGKADVGFVSACRLEQVEADGLVPLGLFKVINKQDSSTFPCLHSTDRYAGIAFITTELTKPEDAKKAALAILRMPVSADGFHWQTATDFSSIKDLLLQLQLGPYAYLRDWSWNAIWSKYRWVFFSILGILGFLIVNELRLRRMVTLRTEALAKATKEKVQLSEDNRINREKLAAAEHSNVVSHLSALVAHELKQPLSTISNRLSILKLRLSESLNEDEESEDSVEAIDRALERAKVILNNVRNYAKSEPSPHCRCFFDAIVNQALNDVKEDMHELSNVHIDVSIQNYLPVEAAPTELRLMVLNLLKNAVREAAKIPDGKISLKLIRKDKLAILRIKNNGPEISSETFAAMCSKMPAMKSLNGGLGLGVALSRTIANNHDSNLEFEKEENGELVAIVKIKLEEETNECDSPLS